VLLERKVKTAAGVPSAVRGTILTAGSVYAGADSSQPAAPVFAIMWLSRSVYSILLSGETR